MQRSMGWWLVFATGMALAASASAAAADTAPGSVRVLLRHTDLDTGAPLPGARFGLWRETNDSPGLQTTGPNGDERHEGACTTDAEGTCTVELPSGETYYWLQELTTTGYEQSEELTTGFDVSADSPAEGLVVNVANRRVGTSHSGVVRVLKRDAKTGNPLPGAVFELWKETNGTTGLQMRGLKADQRVRPGCATDSDGVCEFLGLADGLYFLVETDVREGYARPAAPVSGPWVLDATTPSRRLVFRVYNDRYDQHREPEQDRAAQDLRRVGYPVLSPPLR